MQTAVLPWMFLSWSDTAMLFSGFPTHISKDGPGEGLYTEGCIALVEGEYTQDGTLEVIAIGQPPCEDRDTARSATISIYLMHPNHNHLARYMVISISWEKAQQLY